MSICSCGNEILVNLGKCANCMYNDIMENDVILKENTRINTNYFSLPIFINSNYKDRIFKLQKFIDDNFSNFEIIENNKTYMYENKSYNYFSLKIVDNYNKDELQYVLRLISLTKARSYDFIIENSSDITPLKYVISKDIFNINSVKNLALLFARYYNIFMKISFIPSEWGIFKEPLDELYSLSFEDVKNKLELTQFEFNDNNVCIDIGRGTFNYNSLNNILQIFKNVINVSLTLDENNITQYKNPFIFFNSVCPSEIEFIKSRISLDDGNIQTSDLSEYFGEYEYSDNEEDYEED